MQFLEFLPFSKNVDYHMQLLKFLFLLQKCRLSYENSKIPLPSPKMWTIICNLFNFVSFSKTVDYHMQYLELFSILQKRGLSYAIYLISFPSPKPWTIICN